jgi:hypothetical protein
MIGCGTFWTLTYLLIIRRSSLDQTYGMPLVALCANLSWEFLFSFIFPPQIIQHVVNLIWFSFDLIILFQLLRYGPREFSDLSKQVFYVAVILTLITSFCTVLFITVEFHDAGTYAAFGQNLMMSVLFIVMLSHRRCLRGQSISIATCKLLGTALASLAFYLYSPLSHHSVLLPFLYIVTLFYDVIYVGLVYMQQRAEDYKLKMKSS